MAISSLNGGSETGDDGVSTDSVTSLPMVFEGVRVLLPLGMCRIDEGEN